MPPSTPQAGRYPGAGIVGDRPYLPASRLQRAGIARAGGARARGARSGRVVTTASVRAECIDRWRAPGAPDGATWEERFGEQRYAELGGQLLTRLCDAGVELGGVRRFAVAGMNARAVRSVAKTVQKATGSRSR